MTIDEAYRFINFVSNKEQRGNVTPSQFNNLAKIAQQEFISKRLGNIKNLNEVGVPPFGYESTWKVHTDLYPLVYGPINIPLDPNGGFQYPYGYIWPDSIHKNDFNEIKRLTPDQYPRVKRSAIFPPTEEYPVCIFRGDQGVIDPPSIGSFGMSYVKQPIDPNWDYIMQGDTPIYSGINGKKYLVKNPNFNSGFDNWVQNGGPVSWQIYNGYASIVSVNQGFNSSADLLQLIYPIVGTKISITVDYNSINFSSHSLGIIFADVNKAGLLYVYAAPAGSGDQTITLDANVPAGAKYICFQFYGTSSGYAVFSLKRAQIQGYTNNTSYDAETGKPSQDFMVNKNTSAHQEICMIMLQNIGINLDAGQLAQYAAAKEGTIS